HKLYDNAVETLITSWDANKELSNHDNLQYLELDDLRRLMEILAYWIHTQGNTGDNEGGTLIDCDELLEKLKREIKTLKGIELYKAEEEAKRFIDLIKERTGLLNEQGHNCYAFVHKTFQEYLCAEKINYEADDERDFEIILNDIRDHIHDQHWREVLLLLVSEQKPKQAVRAIRAILNNDSDYEQWLHRDLFFAADCLAEDVKGLNAADEKLGEEILRGLVNLEVIGSNKVGRKIYGQVFDILCRFNETAFEPQALTLIKAEADKIGKVRLQKYRAALGEKEGAINTLIEFLSDDDLIVRCRAADGLGELGEDSDTVVNALVKLLGNDDSFVLSRAADALGKLGEDSDAVMNALVKLLSDDDGRVRYSAAVALVKLGEDSDAVLNVLVKLLSDGDSYVRLIAANSLVKLNQVSDEVVNALVKLLSDGDSYVRLRAADVLGKLGEVSDEVVNALMKLLSDDDSDVRLSAAEALGKLNQVSDEVVNTLVKLLSDDHNYVRSSAAEVLGELGKKWDRILPLIEQWLKENQDAENVGNAINALWDIVAAQ
ncbi:MAG: HEAT repeat domain-containing protein, partial [Rivularia sp. (in: cyanobacteria)]